MRCLKVLSFVVMASCSDLHSEPCKNTETTIKMRECYSAALEESQKELDDLVTTVAEEMRDYLGVKESEEFVSLNKEWLVYVDKICSNQRKLFGQGSIAGISFISCKKQLIDSNFVLFKSMYFDSMNAE